MQARTQCPICSSRDLTLVTERANVPVHQNMPCESLAVARGATRGHLRVVACLVCGFIFNATFDDALMSYGAGYDSDQTYSPTFTSHVDRLVHLLLDDKAVRNSQIVEIGCGKGDFLEMLVSNPANGNCGWGYDPSYVGPESASDGRVHFVRSLYPEHHETITADVAICRHTIEHVSQPEVLLARIRGNVAQARLFMETKDVEWVLRNVVIWDFFYEYCSYFSPHSIANAFRRAGFVDVVSSHMFGGQYLWVEANSAPVGGSAQRDDAGNTAQLVADYVREENEIRTRWTRTLEALGKSGGIALWGAGAKGGTFASLFDPNAELISCVVDINPGKQGRFIAGSGHQIVPPADLSGFDVKSVILLNPNYTSEVRDFLVSNDLDIDLITEPAPA